MATFWAVLLAATAAWAGEVDWQARELVVRVSAAPSPAASSWARGRSGAERRARERLVEAVGRAGEEVRLFGGLRVGEVQPLEPAFVERWLASGEVELNQRTDGGVLLVARLGLGALDGLFARGAQELEAEGSRPHAVILDTRGMAVQPGLLPRVFAGPGKVPRLHPIRAASYFTRLDAARSDPRAGAAPRVVKAAGRAKPSETDLLLAPAEAREVFRLLLAGAPVLVVVDPPGGE